MQLLSLRPTIARLIFASVALATAASLLAVNGKQPGQAQAPATIGITRMAAPAHEPKYPLKISSNGRYLVDQTNRPFLLVGDSPQPLFVNLTESQADHFFADRQAAGFNAVWINLLCDTYTAGRSDGSSHDGLRPFTTPGDLSTPNPAYFSRVDAMLRLAARHRLVVFLDPIETGGWVSTLRSNGVQKDFNYGIYLGKRYKDFPNIVWMSGNDYATSASDDPYVTAVAKGIKSVDHNHIHTLEWSGGHGTSLDDSQWANIVSLNAAYTYCSTYSQVLHGYYQSNKTPVFMVEAHYEGENVGYAGCTELGTPPVLRRQEYWTMLSGATGQLYGSQYWKLQSGWEHGIDSIGVRQLQYMIKLFVNRPWYRLVPDVNHHAVTAGYGTFSDTSNVSVNDYTTAARTSDGSLLLAYMPTARPITVDMSKLARAATAEWYDPTNGKYTRIKGSPFPTRGARRFSPPPRNSAGDSDWVLVLQGR